MSASGKPLSLVGTKADNGSAPKFCLPVSESNIRSLEVGKVNVRRNCSPNDAIFSVVVGDVEHPVPVFNINGSFDVNLCFQKIERHVQVPPTLPQYTEQLEVEAANLNGRNTAESSNLTKLVNFLRAAPFFSPTAEPKPRCVAVTTPANDRWHPLGAA